MEQVAELWPHETADVGLDRPAARTFPTHSKHKIVTSTICKRCWADFNISDWVCFFFTAFACYCTTHINKFRPLLVSGRTVVTFHSSTFSALVAYFFLKRGFYVAVLKIYQVKVGRTIYGTYTVVFQFVLTFAFTIVFNCDVDVVAVAVVADFQQELPASQPAMYRNNAKCVHVCSLHYMHTMGSVFQQVPYGQSW